MPESKTEISILSTLSHAETKFEDAYQKMEKICGELLTVSNIFDGKCREIFEIMVEYTMPGRYGWELARFWCEKLTACGYAKIFDRLFKEFWSVDWIDQLNKSPTQEASNAYYIFDMAIVVACNSCNKVEALCDKIHETKFMETCVKHFQTHPEFQPEKLFTKPDYRYLDTCGKLLGILHNILRIRSDWALEFRELKGVEMCTAFVISAQNHKERIGYKQKSLMATAAIVSALTVSEDQMESLQAMEETFEFLMNDVLAGCVKEKSRIHLDLTCEGVLKGLHALAVMDRIKLKLCNEKTLKLYLDIIQNATLMPELQEVVNGFWILSFHKDCKTAIKTMIPECIKRLKELENHEKERISKAAKGALWNLEGQRPKTAKTDAKNRPTTTKPEKGKLASGSHVMISYDWRHQDVVKLLNQQLKACGFKTWFDTEQMSGSTLEAMAEAIEEAAVVVVCMSEEYKKSPNCKKEAEYADQLHKQIVPVRTQAGYHPDGWLGILVGKKLYFDCFREDLIPLAAERLGKELEKLSSKAGDAPVVPVFKPKTAKHSARALQNQNGTNSLDEVKTWSKTRVGQWLGEHSLGHLKDKMDKMDGSLLLQLHGLYRKSPQLFMMMMDKMGVSSPEDLLMFTNALDDL